MSVNYDVFFEQIKNTVDISNPPKLLLHACCAPCSTYCLTRVLPYFDTTLYYANDNITDEAEWRKRLDELKKLTTLVNEGQFETQPLRPLKLIVPPFDAGKFFKAIRGQEDEPEGGARCNTCFFLRLADTMQFAQNNGFDMFGTTLSVSPYKNSQILNTVGLSLQTDSLRWLPADFKKRGGYGESVRLSSQYGLYRQHYCGCEFSLRQAQLQSVKKTTITNKNKIKEVNMFNQALQLIRQYDTIIIHRHSNPDGDAIGSQVGMRELIRHNFPNKSVYIVGDGTKRYAFMEGWTPDEIAENVYKDALAIILDTSVRTMIADDRYAQAKATLRFDHHIFCEKIADVDIVDTSYESCCGLVTDFAYQTGLKFNLLAAKSLFTGMVTDSGRFRYDATNARTFRLASILREQDFDTNEIYADLYADDFDMILLRAKYVQKIQFTEHKVGYIITTKEELNNLDADEFTVSRGMVGVMSDIRGVDSWVNFTETDHGVLCELRSKAYNINPIATKYGGGGHAKASGATVDSLDTAMKMLADLDALHNA